MNTAQKIRWQGEEYILVGGAITTPERYAAFECSVAHLFEDGRIMQFKEQVGTEEDIEYLEEIEVEGPGLHEVLQQNFGMGWGSGGDYATPDY